MLDNKMDLMDRDLIWDVREFLVNTLETEQLSEKAKQIRLGLVKRFSSQTFQSKTYQDMSASPKKDKTNCKILISNEKENHDQLNNINNTICYEEISNLHYENNKTAKEMNNRTCCESYTEHNTYENINEIVKQEKKVKTNEEIKKISPTSSTSSIVSTSQYNEIANNITNNKEQSNQYENTKEILQQLMNNNNSNIIQTKHGNIEIKTKNGFVEKINNTNNEINGKIFKNSDERIEYEMKSKIGFDGFDRNMFNRIQNDEEQMRYNTKNGGFVENINENNGNTEEYIGYEQKSKNGIADKNNIDENDGIVFRNPEERNGYETKTKNEMLNINFKMNEDGIIINSDGTDTKNIDHRHKKLNTSYSVPLIQMCTSALNDNNIENHEIKTENNVKSQSQSNISNKSNPINCNNIDILSISASALKYSALRCGNLLKKDKILFVDHYKKYWIALVNEYIYMYNNDKDLKACNVINIVNQNERIYNARPSTSREKDFIFEIVSPGLKTHYFAANSAADMELWISAINRCDQTTISPSSPTESQSVRQSSLPSISTTSSETSRELPSLPTTPKSSYEQFYDEPDVLIRPIIHNYEHMVNQETYYNEIEEKDTIQENYYNITSHSAKNNSNCETISNKAQIDFETEQERLRELSMQTYDLPKSNKYIYQDTLREETTNNGQSNRIQHIIKKMEASCQQKEPNICITPNLRKQKRPESQVIVSNQMYEPIRRNSLNRNSR